MSSSLIAALVLSSSLIGPSSHLGVDAFSPIGSASGSTSSVAQHVSNAAATALHLSNQPSADSIVNVYGGGGSGANNNNGGGNKRRRSGRNSNNKRRSAAGTSSSSQSKGKRRNNKNQNARRSSSSPNRQSSARPVARSAAETAKSREQHLELRSKLEETQQRNGQGEELSRELDSSLDGTCVRKMYVHIVYSYLLLRLLIVACAFHCPISSESYCDELLGLCVATDEWDSVLEVLAVMKDQGLSQTRSSYRACLEQCSKVNNGVSAQEILKAMRQAGVEPYADDVTLAVKTMCRGGRWRNAKALVLRSAEQLLQLPVDNTKHDKVEETADIDTSNIMSVDAYNAVMSAMKEEKNWKEAVQFLALMEKGQGSSNKGGAAGGANVKTAEASKRVHPRPTLVTYHHALEACVSAAESEQAVTLLMSMRDKGADPTSHTFELVVRGLLKRSQWRRALQLLDLMEEWEVPQSTRIYNIIISACAKAREVGQAMALLKKMRSLSIKPDVVTFNALISACASAGRWKDSMSLLQQCQREPGVDPDIITYTNAMRACARARKYKDAIELLEVLQDLGLKPDVYAYTAAIDACAKGKMWRKALDILDEMRTRGVQPSEVTYSVAITACGNGGQWQRAMELLNQMRMKGMPINVITYSSTISALAKAARRNLKGTVGGEGIADELSTKALDLLEQMKKEGVEPDAYSYSGAISACASAGRWKEALDLMSQMKKGGPKTRPNRITYTAAVSACGRAGEWEHALRLFDEMRNDGLQADRISYNAVVSALRIVCSRTRHMKSGEKCAGAAQRSKAVAARPDRRLNPSQSPMQRQLPTQSFPRISSPSPM